MLKLAAVAALALGLGAFALPSAPACCASEESAFATCSPNGTCRACKNCKYCANCSKGGGSCSICKKK